MRTVSERVMRWKALLGNIKKSTWCMLLGIGGILLIGISTLLSGSETADTSTVTDSTAVYAAALESRLEEMVSSVAGAGACRVMVTLENGVEYVYANEEKSNSDHTQSDGGNVSVRDDSQKTVVTVDAEKGKEGLLVTEIQPTVRGVVVACEGASSEYVAELVKEAVKTALNITDKRVCVIPYQSEGER